MPTVLPLAPAPSPDRRRMLRLGALLCAMLAVPVVAVVVLESVLAARCTTHVEAQGVLVEKTLWRIERKDCAGAKLPFYDVLIGVEGKAFASALTGRGEPRPVFVEASGPTTASIRLSAPLLANTPDKGAGVSAVSVQLRRSGTPKERIDLESLNPGRASERRP